MRIFLLLGCISVLTLGGCQDQPKDTADKPASPETAAVSVGRISKIVNATGTVEPELTVQVGSEISGKLLSVNVDFNAVVKKGDILAVIDPDNFQNRLAQNEAQVENARAQIKINEASLKRAEVNHAQAIRSFDRRSQLYAENAISQAQLEETEKTLRLAEADIELAQARLDAAISSVKQSQANLRTAQVDLSRTIIRSPIDGIVIERKVDPGQTVAASLSAPELFKIANSLERLNVNAAIVESDVSGLNAGDRVSFNVDAYPAKRFRGTVEQLRLQSKTTNNIVTYTAVVKAENSEGLLLPGMTASLQITTDSKEKALRIPAAAERFRPSPSEIKIWQAEQTGVAEVDIDPKARDRLSQAGVPKAEIGTIMNRMRDETATLRERIADPTQNFRRTPNLKRLSQMTESIIKDSLSSSQFQAYQQIKQSQSQIRDAEIWTLVNDKIDKRQVSLGLSDGSFVEVLSGLSENDQVVTGFSGGARQGPPAGVRRRR